MQIGFAPRLAALYAAMFVVFGIQLPFFPVWLKAKGLDAGMIGVVLAAPIVVRVFSITWRRGGRPPRRPARRNRGGERGERSGLCAGRAWPPDAAAILFAYTLAALVFTPLMPLAEAYALKGLAARGRAYGPVRLWGSAAFIAGTFIAGVATDTIPARHLIWLIVRGLRHQRAGGGAACAAVGRRAGCGRNAARPRRSAARSCLHRRRGRGQPDPGEPRGLLQLLGAAMARRRASTARRLPALWALGVIAEIVLFALQGRLPHVDHADRAA